MHTHLQRREREVSIRLRWSGGVRGLHTSIHRLIDERRCTRGVRGLCGTSIRRIITACRSKISARTHTHAQAYAHARTYTYTHPHVHTHACIPLSHEAFLHTIVQQNYSHLAHCFEPNMSRVILRETSCRAPDQKTVPESRHLPLLLASKQLSSLNKVR